MSMHMRTTVVTRSRSRRRSQPREGVDALVVTSQRTPAEDAADEDPLRRRSDSASISICAALRVV